MERTSCNFPWGFSIPVRISGAPAAVTNVKFTITGNTDGQDYTISPDSVSFSPTDSADKSFSIIINPDAVTEGHEQAKFYLTISDTNALAADPYELIIINDDWPPFNGKRFSGTFFSEDFETPSAGWITYDYIKGTNKWLIGGSNGNVSSGKSAYISNNASSLSYSAASMSHTLLYHEVDATNWDSLYFSFYYKCKGQNTSGIKKDFGKIMYSLDSLTFYQINGTTDLADSSNATSFSMQLPYFLWNRKFYLGFYWQNDTATANDPPFAIDDISITGKTFMVAQIHTAADTATGYCEKPLGPFETVDFYDGFSGDVLATIQNLSGHNYGCVKVEVDRAGTGAQWVTGDPQTTAKTQLFDKTYKVTPENNNATGDYNITFYVTQAEYQGWQFASTNALAQVRMIKYSGPISTMTYTSTFDEKSIIPASYLSGVHKTFKSFFNTGFSGFGFGNIPLSTLPVHIVSFTAKEYNKTVNLLWKTENEENLSYYKVMRSHNGTDYETIGTVTARGTNNATEEYLLNDPQPYTGKNFYQLISYDRDGTFKKSQIVEVNIRSGIIYTTSPNPFTDKITIGISGSSPQPVQIKLTDLQGRAVMTKQINNPAGPVTMQIPDIAAGVYLLKITDEENTQVFKLIKQ